MAAKGTSLYDPGTGTPAPADPIGDQFGKTMGIFNPPSTQIPSTTGMPSGGSYVQPEKVEGNSLDQITRSITNLLGAGGPATFGAGTNILQSGLGVTDTGLQLFGQPLSYWQKLLSGDQQAMTDAVAPEAQATATQYDAATRAAETGMPKGGYASTKLAGLPFQKAQDIQTLYQKLRPQAATAVSDIAGKVTTAGQGIAGMGLGEQALGLQQLAMAMQSLLQRRGQNVAQDSQTMTLLGDIAKALGTVYGAVIAGG